MPNLQLVNAKENEEKILKLPTNDTRPSPPEASTCELLQSGDNQVTANISSRKFKTENLRLNYASFTRRTKEFHKSIQKKDNRLERSIDDSADLVIESERSCENRSVRDSKVDFSELLRSLKKDNRKFFKTVGKPLESLSTSGSTNAVVNVTPGFHLDSWHK